MSSTPLMMLDDEEQVRVLIESFVRAMERTRDGDIPLLLDWSELLDDAGGPGESVEAVAVTAQAAEREEWGEADTTDRRAGRCMGERLDALASNVAMSDEQTAKGIAEWDDDEMELDDSPANESDLREIGTLMACIRGDSIEATECECVECQQVQRVLPLLVHLQLLECELESCRSGSRGRSGGAQQRRLTVEIRQAQAQIMVLERYWQE